ncbi:class I SAM-dependent methyltransferase [Kineococcus sp. NUM-3379]
MGLYARELRPRLLDATMHTEAMTGARVRACAGLAGDVLEIGYGSGRNQPHLPRQVRGVWAVEPSATALALSAQRRAASPVPVVVAGGDARDLPFPDDRFDAALSTWTLCGIPDPDRVLREVARVLKPGATLRFVEHGLAPDEPVARWQRRFSGVNRHLAGCVLDLDVRALLEGSPLTVLDLETFYEEGAPKVPGFTYAGSAAA